MSNAERWARLWDRWSGMFGPPYDTEIIDEVDGYVAFGPCSPAAKRVLLFEDLPGLQLARGAHPDEVADEMVAAVRWFLPHVRKAKLDPIPLRRLLGWLEHWTSDTTDYRDGIAFADEARYQIDECIDVRGDHLDEGGPDADDPWGDKPWIKYRRQWILWVVGEGREWIGASEIKKKLPPSLSLSPAAFGRALTWLRDGMKWMKDNGKGSKAMAYRVTDLGLKHRVEPKKPPVD